MDSLEPPLISVLMPCHNAAPYVGEAVASVLAQTYPHVQLVIVDDGSTDGSSEILQQLATAHPERITLVYQNRAGPWAARNHALARARQIHRLPRRRRHLGARGAGTSARQP
jgi:glycosyltransferase involved in cell wall biosynthesis